MSKVITDKKKDKKSTSVVHVFIEGDLKPVRREKLERVHLAPIFAPASTDREKVKVQKYPQGLVNTKMTKVGIGSPIAPLLQEVASTERYSNYINYLKEQDDKDMDHMSWSLKRFSKKK
jgi:hypothetical protein